ncbi:MAG: type II toxin-antitoxin system RelE/ParE family toxin [Clostridiaceae bacterium]|jgi:toxin ParE1/3/4|nr:type II toxin-antitoxin system RelE/ParE family toxin [Clostridiaceae bacterium]
MDKYSVEITEPAEYDLLEIKRYISEELYEPKIAERIISNIADAIFELEDMPFRYALVSDERLALCGMRKLIIDNYIVFYIVDERIRTVTIVRVLYVRRNWADLL